MLSTWQKEALCVASILLITTLFTGCRTIEWLGSCAVLLAFMHAQVGYRLQEAEESRPLNLQQVHCYRWLNRYFILKEIFWFVYFVLLGAWSALIGVFIFLLYPLWRKLHLRSHRHA